MDNSGAWKTCYHILHYRAKGGGNKVEYGGVYMIWKIVKQMEKKVYSFNYVLPRTYNYLNSKYITIVATSGVKLTIKYVLPDNSKEKGNNKVPSYPLILVNFETAFAITVDKNRINPSGAIEDRFI